LYAVSIAITLAPFIAVHLPGLGDTINHLARMHILATIDHSPDLQRFYVVHWSPIPYLAMDFLVPLLAHLFSLDGAAKIFIAACVLMPCFGAATLHYAVHRRLSLVPAAALLLGANYLLQLGFLNYLFMMGIAASVLALWIASTSWRPKLRVALFMGLVTLLYLGHAFAFAGYCCAVAGFEVAAAIRAGFAPARKILARWVCAGLTAAPALFLAATLNASAGAPGRLYSSYGDVGEKLLAAMSPVVFRVDAVQCLVAGACLVIGAVIAKWLRVSAKIWPSVLAVALAAAAMPEILLSTWLTDFRLPLFAAILLIGGISVPWPARARLPVAAMLVVLLGTKSADIWRLLQVTDTQIGEMRQVISALPRGVRLLVTNESGENQAAGLSGSTIWSMPLLAVIDRDAFVPTLFTGLTTVHVRPDFAASSTPQGNPTTLARLAGDLAARPPELSPVEQREGLKVYWHDWPRTFDYLLVEHFFAASPASWPDHLKSVAKTADLDLYKIEK